VLRECLRQGFSASFCTEIVTMPVNLCDRPSRAVIARGLIATAWFPSWAELEEG
jgi:hypothetical protein